MINLKLAQYSEEGKFEKYLELGKDFLYGGNSIVFHNPNNQHLYKWKDATGLTRIDYELDKKDPLGRFNGLFDKRIYGEGKFVLIYGCFGQIWDTIEECEDNYFLARDGIFAYSHAQPIGNIFENPELWEKVK